ncbi:uncharacterized protein F5891DRAFT_1186809 [Suillus fuscotomentosus]|uniref:Transmembrane protein n=1 Tax=Suillus fuscotomentosus TaxID=1912939 RepID=A0AAD4E9K2_9AGAM|nr:uncharacterized protein F5891DRAFT_1186809 [Suillus fuscotomentosus]KAG1902230.1 hypothetical protein F5891DRAFT_1186809 [Suillus fuscotomentosus]
MSATSVIRTHSAQTNVWASFTIFQGHYGTFSCDLARIRKDSGIVTMFFVYATFCTMCNALCTWLYKIPLVKCSHTHTPPLPPGYGIIPPNSYSAPFLPSQPYSVLSRVPYEPEQSDGEDDNMIARQVLSQPFTQPAPACKVAGSRCPNAVPSQAKGKRKALATTEPPTKKRLGRGGRA